MVYEEAMRCGKVLGIAVPVPPPEVPDSEGCRVYVKFGSSTDAAKCKEMMDGRLFDDNKVGAAPDGCVAFAAAPTACVWYRTPASIINGWQPGLAQPHTKLRRVACCLCAGESHTCD